LGNYFFLIWVLLGSLGIVLATTPEVIYDDAHPTNRLSKAARALVMIAVILVAAPTILGSALYTGGLWGRFLIGDAARVFGLSGILCAGLRIRILAVRVHRVSLRKLTTLLVCAVALTCLISAMLLVLMAWTHVFCVNPNWIISFDDCKSLRLYYMVTRGFIVLFPIDFVAGLAVLIWYRRLLSEAMRIHGK